MNHCPNCGTNLKGGNAPALSDKEKKVARGMQAKGYTHVVQFEEDGKDFGEPLYFKNPGDAGPFMRTRPNMKMKWTAKIEDVL